MTLYIDTTQNNLIEISLKDKTGRVIAAKKFKSHRTQAEKLLPAVEKLLKANRLKLKDIKRIEAANNGGSFTSLRIGVVTANALGYALKVGVKGDKGTKAKGVKFSVVEPLYDREPEITKKRRICG